MDFEVKASPAKQEAVKRIESSIEKADSIFFTDFTGLSVSDMNRLRNAFFEAGEVEYLVAKNTLTRLALLNKGYESAVEEMDEIFAGPSGLAMGFSDPITPVKIIAEFAKANGKPVFKGGIVDGQFVNKEDVEKLKDIPPVDQLYSLIVGGIANPLSSFVGVLNETLRSFVGVLDAIIEKKKAEESADA